MSIYSIWQLKRGWHRVDLEDTVASKREMRIVSPALMKEPSGLEALGMHDRRQEHPPANDVFEPPTLLRQK